MTDRLLSTSEVAERVGVTVMTVRVWLRSGELHGVKAGPRLWRVRESDLDRFLEERETGAS